MSTLAAGSADMWRLPGMLRVGRAVTSLRTARPKHLVVLHPVIWIRISGPWDLTVFKPVSLYIPGPQSKTCWVLTQGRSWEPAFVSSSGLAFAVPELGTMDCTSGPWKCGLCHMEAISSPRVRAEKICLSTLPLIAPWGPLDFDNHHWDFFSKSHVQVQAPAPNGASLSPFCLASFLSALGIAYFACLIPSWLLFIPLHISLSMSWLTSHHPLFPGNWLSLWLRCFLFWRKCCALGPFPLAWLLGQMSES